jgi:hypothetical protein
MEPIIINGTIKRDVPRSYDEITFGKYCEIFYDLKDNPDSIPSIDIANEVTIFSRILDVDEDLFFEGPTDFFYLIKKIFSFIYERESFFLKDVDNELVLDGKIYRIPDNEEITLRQHIDLDITNNEKDSPTKLIEILAIALVEAGKKYTGDEKERLAMIEKLKHIPSTEAFHLLGFFLLKEKLSKTYTEICTLLTEELDKLPQHIQTS